MQVIVRRNIKNVNVPRPMRSLTAGLSIKNSVLFLPCTYPCLTLCERTSEKWLSCLRWKWKLKNSSAGGGGGDIPHLWLEEAVDELVVSGVWNTAVQDCQIGTPYAVVSNPGVCWRWVVLAGLDVDGRKETKMKKKYRMKSWK